MHKLVHVLTSSEPTIDRLEAALEPYSAHLEVDPYVEDSYTLSEMKACYSNGADITPEEGIDLLEQDYELVYYNPEARTWDIMGTINPDCEWDWWVIGGRFKGALPSGRTQMKIGDIAWKREDAAAECYANIIYDRFEQETAGLEVPPPQMTAPHRSGSNINLIRQGQREYPWLKVVEKLTPIGHKLEPLEYWKVNSGGRDAFVRSQIDTHYTPAAYIDLTGAWVDDPENYREILKSHHPDTWITAVDTHL